MHTQNLYQAIPAHLPEEVMETLAQSSAVKIKRIISHGHCSPPNFWYDQDQHEWVVLLKGKASIRFYEEQQVVHLEAGDYLTIPAHVRHRVESTSTEEPCVWLAVFY